MQYSIRSYLSSIKALGVLGTLSFFQISCSTLPSEHYKTYRFPAEVAFIQEVKRPFRALGEVKSKVDYQSLDPIHDEKELCQNYFNKAVLDMVKMARAKKADAVISVKSVVFYENGQRESFATPECSDDGMEGQILTQGIAVQWLDKKQAQNSTPLL